MKSQRSEIREGDSVSHPILGEGEVIEVISSVYAKVLWDRDPTREYNMGSNPSLEYLSTLTLINDE